MKKQPLLNILIEISQKMNESLKLEEILTSIVEITKEYIGVSRVSVFIKMSDKLVLKAYAGFEPELPVEIPLGEGVSGKVAQSGEACVINHGTDNIGEYSATSFMSFPIRSGEQILGVINLTDKYDDFFDGNDRLVAEYISFQCALAIDRHSLYQKMLHAEHLQTVGILRASIVHDIRNMLGIVETYLVLAEDDPSPETLHEYFHAIRSEIARVQGLANDMLDYAKQSITLNYKQFCLDELCQSVAKEINLSLKYTDLSVVYYGKGQIQICADEERLYRVIFNLVNNAIQALGEKGIVVIRARRYAKDKVSITVFDNGKGIPGDKLKDIFEAFQGFDKVKSTGLGLSIVKDIVSAHNGSIGVRSKTGKYTMFRILLPVSREV